MAMHPHTDELTPNVSSFNPITDRELQDIENYLARSKGQPEEQEPEPERRVKINIRASIIGSTNRLPLNQVQDEDPDYLSNLILINDSKENSMKTIFSLTPGMTLDSNETIFNRYDIPFFTSKVSFKTKFDFGAMTASVKKDDKDEEEDELGDELPLCNDKEKVFSL